MQQFLQNISKIHLGKRPKVIPQYTFIQIYFIPKGGRCARVQYMANANDSGYIPLFRSVYAPPLPRTLHISATTIPNANKKVSRSVNFESNESKQLLTMFDKMSVPKVNCVLPESPLSHPGSGDWTTRIQVCLHSLLLTIFCKEAVASQVGKKLPP